MRSPTEISLAQLAHIPSHEDIGEGTSRSVIGREGPESPVHIEELVFPQHAQEGNYGAPPPEYTSPEGSVGRRGSNGESRNEDGNGERRPLLGGGDEEEAGPQVPSYDVAVGNEPGRERDRDRERRGRERERERGRRNNTQESTER